jgi:hypothetical protein
VNLGFTPGAKPVIVTHAMESPMEDKVKQFGDRTKC